jgi:hypothetical protein
VDRVAGVTREVRTLHVVALVAGVIGAKTFHVVERVTAVATLTRTPQVALRVVVTVVVAPATFHVVLYDTWTDLLTNHVAARFVDTGVRTAHVVERVVLTGADTFHVVGLEVATLDMDRVFHVAVRVAVTTPTTFHVAARVAVAVAWTNHVVALNVVTEMVVVHVVARVAAGVT